MREMKPELEKNSHRYSLELADTTRSITTGIPNFRFLLLPSLGISTLRAGLKQVDTSFELFMNERYKLILSLLKSFHRHLVYSSCPGVLSNLPPRHVQSSWVVDPFRLSFI